MAFFIGLRVKNASILKDKSNYKRYGNISQTALFCLFVEKVESLRDNLFYKETLNA